MGDTQTEKKRMLLSIIMPVYNEGVHIRETLDKIIAAPLPAGVDKEIIAIDDGSIDDSGRILEEYAKNGDIATHDLIVNCGKGTAVRMGLRKATGDIILIQDGDLEYDPDDYVSIIQPIVDGRAEVVYGSRFLGRIEKMRFVNRMGNITLNVLSSLLYGVKITDQFTAYKAFKAGVIRSLQLRCRGFEFCSEVTNKLLKRGVKITEVPIRYRGRSAEDGKKGGSWRDFFVALYYIIEYRFFKKKA